MSQNQGRIQEPLFAAGGPSVYRGRERDEVAFPLGGIGTGTISLGGWGQLRDFEIFNRPNKDFTPRDTFLAVWAAREGEPGRARVLQGPVGGTWTRDGSGHLGTPCAGLPRFQANSFTGGFPFARVDFEDASMPVDAALEAFNPFIPLNPDDSGIPGALLTVILANPGARPVDALVTATLENVTGYPECGDGEIKPFERNGVRGLFFSTRRHAPDSPRYGTLALATSQANALLQTSLGAGAWFDHRHRFWDRLSEGSFEERADPIRHEGGTDIGAIGLRARIAPGETVRLPVWICWHTPNFEMYWENYRENRGEKPNPVWRNYYATRFEDAADVAGFLGREYERLESDTRLFADALFSSTLPRVVLDAVSSQLSVLKSTTCIRLEDGTFYAFEGCSPASGCCDGTCTHVWNYAQALAYLFPSLERSIRDADYACNLGEKGHMQFRMALPLGTDPPERFHAAADGQLGGIAKVYRDWQISGDTEWLRGIWPKARRALEYAWVDWDKSQSGLIEGIQHNTYDIEFHGPNSMIGTWYLAALRAGEELARAVGDTEAADSYRAVFEKGRERLEQELYNGEYYFQQIVSQDCESAESDACGCGPKSAGSLKYQYGTGCLSDQVIGQWMASLAGLGDLLNRDRVRSALNAVFRYNWMDNLTEHSNAQRVYALNGESGLLLCTWPHGGRPEIPFPYSDEVWCGIEYQVASHLIMEGFVEEGLRIVEGVRCRHTGERRNPWNEFECGNHYARSLASWALVPALSGITISNVEKRLAIDPRVHRGRFLCFFPAGTGWGLAGRRETGEEVDYRVQLLHGKLVLGTLSTRDTGFVKEAVLGDELLKVERDSKGDWVFNPPIVITPERALEIRIVD